MADANKSARRELSAAQRALLSLLRALQEAGYDFTTVSPATHARVNARAGNEAARDLAGVFGWSRPFAANCVPETIFALMQAAGVVASEGDLWRSLIRVSSLDGELFAHSAFPTAAADTVFFGPDTYRFARAIKAGTEALRRPVKRAADIGCGAGPGGVLIAKAYPRADVFMTDINRSALLLAQVNAALAACSRAFPRHSDILSGVDGTFDLIVANPPYLNDPLRRAYRHGGGALGADLSQRILAAALDRLSPQGTLILYTGVAIVAGRDPFRAALAARLNASDLAWSYAEVDPDVFGEELDTDAYAGADRIAAIVLTVTKGG